MSHSSQAVRNVPESHIIISVPEDISELLTKPGNTLQAKFDVSLGRLANFPCTSPCIIVLIHAIQTNKENVFFVDLPLSLSAT